MIDDGTTETANRNTPRMIRNSNGFAVIYRINFAGAGWVQISLPPGGNFTFVSELDTVDLYIEHIFPMGVQAFDDSEGHI